MKGFLSIAALVSVFVLGVAFVAKRYGDAASQTRGDGPLMVFCAAGLRPPVTAIAESYRQEIGQSVQFQFGGSASLLGSLRTVSTGDLFIAADDGVLADARAHNLIREVIPLGRQTPVIAVASGNPKKILGVQDLFRADVRVALANPESASIGRTIKKALGDRWPEMAAKVSVTKPTVMDLLNDLKVGSADAAVVWNTTTHGVAGLESVPVPEWQPFSERASAAVLASCKQPAAALRFARFLSAPERGAETMKAAGYAIEPGDKWEPRPKLVIYSGGVNRLAVQKTIEEFAEREGAEVTTVFNGCGILCASMKVLAENKEADFPDAYYACDICFIPPVAAFYPKAQILTEAKIVLAVAKGNPHKIATLSDLAKPGLRVGICNAEQSTIGFMTQGLLHDTGLKKAVMENVKSQTPTADFLINQLQTGSLDAAIVYNINAKPVSDKIDTIDIPHPGARAIQPFAVAETSPRRLMAWRLLDAFRANRARFEEVGFVWRGDEPPIDSLQVEVPPWLRQSQ